MTEPATDEMIESWFRPPQKPYRCCRDLTGDGCSECATVFDIDDKMIRALIARIELTEGRRFGGGDELSG